MAQEPTPQQMAEMMKMLQQAQQSESGAADSGPTWQVVTEVVNIDNVKSTLSTENFSKSIIGKNPILSDKYLTNQIDGGADLLFNISFSEKIKIESITLFCKPHSNPADSSNDNNNNNNNNDNSNENKDNAENANAANDENATDATESKADNDNNDDNDDNDNDNDDVKPSCPRRLYFSKTSETLSSYFENDINSRNDEYNGVSLIKLNDNDLLSSNGFTISFLKNRPKVYKGTGLRQNNLIFGLTHEPNKLDEDDDDDTDVDMDGEEKYQSKSIYISGIIIKAAGQVSNKQDFEAQMKSIEKIKKGD